MIVVHTFFLADLWAASSYLFGLISIRRFGIGRHLCHVRRPQTRTWQYAEYTIEQLYQTNTQSYTTPSSKQGDNTDERLLIPLKIPAVRQAAEESTKACG